MGNSWFQFQQFRVNQDRCAMKISTDAVLLGTLAKAENPSKILDIGTGTGVIALMLAQRFLMRKLKPSKLMRMLRLRLKKTSGKVTFRKD